MTISSMHVWESSCVRSHDVPSGFYRLQEETKNYFGHLEGIRKYSGEETFPTAHWAVVHTFFPQQEIQKVVGVGHSDFSFHLRPSEGGVDVAGAALLFSLPQLWEPTPHFSKREEEKIRNKIM